MAIKHSITLSTTEPNNEVGVIKIRQADEQTQMLDAQITENGVPKSYQEFAVFFCAKLGQTAGLGIIEQKLKPEEMTDPANGKLEYTMRDEDWQILGRQKGYFSFRKLKDDHEFVEQFTTRDFTFDVIKSVYSEGFKEVRTDGSTYVWTLEDLIRLFNEYMASGKSDWEEFVEQNRDVLESVDPGGKLIGELIDARKPEESVLPYSNLSERLDKQIGLNSEFREFENGESFLQRTKNEFYEREINLNWFEPRRDAETDDSNAFYLATNTGNKTFVPRGVYALSIPVEAVNDISADFATLKAKTEGIPYLLSLKNKDTLVIQGLNFDLNLLGRGGLHISGVKKVIVKDCEFTGYTAQFGYYKTDSCLLISDCEDIVVDNCYFHDTGYQYGEDLDTLNRCITIQGDNVKRALISNCRIARANQGIVASGANLDITITNCDFESTKDNSIYFIPVKIGKVFGCSFDDKYDESIVLTGGNFIIDNCLFKNAPNKFIAIAGNVTKLSLINLTIISSAATPTGNVFSYRDNNYRIKHLNISNWTIELFLTKDYDVFSFGNVDFINIDNLFVSVIGGSMIAGQRLFSFRGTVPKKGRINDVSLVADGGTINSAAIFAEGALDKNTSLTDNDFTCRSTLATNNKFYRLNPNVNSSLGPDSRRIYSAGTTPVVGSWEVGDIIFNTTPTMGGSLNCAGWICTASGTPGSWRKFGILE